MLRISMPSSRARAPMARAWSSSLTLLSATSLRSSTAFRPRALAVSSSSKALSLGAVIWFREKVGVSRDILIRLRTSLVVEGGALGHHHGFNPATFLGQHAGIGGH